MLFNSWKFVVFFLAVWMVYLALRRHFRWQNLFLLVASYAFYGAWDWRFAGLLAGTTVIDYVAGLGIEAAPAGWRRRACLLLSLTSNLTVLGFFKYYNFFLASLDGLLAPAGLSVEALHLQLVLPVGLSFYTFQSISYTVSVYRGEMPAERNLLHFALFVAFFPQLVAGPIERARVLIDQINRPRSLDEAGFRAACWLIAWGLWKKVVLADNLGVAVDPLFARSETLTFAEGYLAVLAFAFQIYCDFSGYSDIARGTARLLGFELMLNFHSPYFAVSPSDFWRRWHISLSSWLRDYLYIPLGGNRGSALATYRNLMLTMTLGGLWHGASWNFVWWGVYHGGLLCVYRRFGGESGDGVLARLGRWLVMFQLTLFGWLLFRCSRVVVDAAGIARDDSFAQLTELLTCWRNGLGFDASALPLLALIAACAVPLLAVEAVEALRGRPAGEFTGWRRPALIGLGSVLAFSLLFWGVTASTTFIYFQF